MLKMTRKRQVEEESMKVGLRRCTLMMKVEWTCRDTTRFETLMCPSFSEKEFISI